MEDICIMKKLVSKFVDTYMGEPGITSLTEKDADNAVEYFHDLLFEDYRPEPADAQPDLPIEQERAARFADKKPTLAEISQMFMARYRCENDIDGALTEDDWLKASEVFLSYVRTI